MGKLISICYVIESHDCGFEPIIYLNRPEINPLNEKLYHAENPFQAKSFLKAKLGDVFVMVTKETNSQLHTLAK